MKTVLLVIDPQNDFCNVNGALYVGGADKDMMVLSEMINRAGANIDEIVVSIDSHHVVDIAHAPFWINDKQENPPIYSNISVEDVETGKWKPSLPNLKDWVKEYVKGLYEKGNLPLIIWPLHCLIDSWGAEVYPVLLNKLTEWEAKVNKKVSYYTKGMNFKTENYSVFEAEYPDPNDSTTNLNLNLIKKLDSYDRILIAGEARTHCVANSIKSMAKYIDMKKVVFLEDTSSNVPIPEVVKATDYFFNELVEHGMTITSTDKIL